MTGSQTSWIPEQTIEAFFALITDDLHQAKLLLYCRSHLHNIAVCFCIAKL